MKTQMFEMGVSHSRRSNELADLICSGMATECFALHGMILKRTLYVQTPINRLGMWSAARHV
jgi:hypothetical protein